MHPLVRKIHDELIKLLEDDHRLTSKFLLAVSGGMDSMVMAHLFSELPLTFGIAHFNFKLRGDASDLDEELVHRFCEENKIPLYIRSEDTTAWAQKRNLSTQVAARELRYAFFAQIAEEHSYDYVCTAHHGHDQVETFLINLFRGSGLKGLSGIPQIRGRIIRPMLWIPQDEIRQFAHDSRVSYRDDESNQSDKYLRNRIRHQMLEPLTKTHPQYLRKALDSISALKDYQKYIETQIDLFRNQRVQQISPDIQKISIPGQESPDFAASFLIKLYLLDHGLYPDSVQDFIDSAGEWKTGTQFEGHHVNAWYDRGTVWLIRDTFYDGWSVGDSVELTIGSEIVLPGGDRISFPQNRPRSNRIDEWIVPISRSRVVLPLKMRHRLPGDVILLGTAPFTRKSLKKLFNDYTIPLPFKDRVYVLADAKNRIIAIPGVINSPAFTDEDNADLFIGFQSKLTVNLGPS